MLRSFTRFMMLTFFPLRALSQRRRLHPFSKRCAISFQEGVSSGMDMTSSKMASYMSGSNSMMKLCDTLYLKARLLKVSSVAMKYMMMAGFSPASVHAVFSLHDSWIHSLYNVVPHFWCEPCQGLECYRVLIFKKWQQAPLFCITNLLY